MKLTLLLLMASLTVSIECAAEDLPPAQTTRVFGQEIRFFDLGSGPPLVLLHGLGQSAEGDWGTVLLPLSKGHRVLALDQLGFGGSAKPIMDYRIQTWVDFLGEFLRQRHIEHFGLAGESLGGWIAAQYAIQALSQQAAGPAFALPKPDRLILCDAGGHRWHPSPGPSIPLDTSSLEGCRNLLSAIFYDPARHSDAAVRAFFAKALARGDGYTIHSVFTNPAIAGEFVEGKLGAITIPTLVIWGDHDQVVPIADGRDFAAKIPGARLVVIPMAGHATEIEQPEAFLAAVATFLAPLGDEAAPPR